ETELQIIQLDQDLKREVATELRDSQGKIGELVERKVAAEDQLKRIEIRAPQSGYVHQLAVHTIGGVINPGEPIMLIVPQADSLVVETRIAPQDIDQVHPGQRVNLRFSAFSQRTTPEIFGTVSRVSADLTREQQTNTSYYTVRVSIPEDELKKLEGKALIPGMPVEAFIQTGSRTALSYLVKPFEDQVARAFRER
ncbi:MAG TPA: HlyD family type I secretion periplasmic adaptor subunit, partial [Beijerinckiaceae bacterium]|nr:HlyD family type I secretion periplasmic adaptor subunit [Beijerinckiaceae bacterium]